VSKHNDKPSWVAFYSRYKELIHVAGFLLLFAFTLGGNWTKYQAQAQDIDDLKNRTTRLEYAAVQVLQNLQDIKDFLHVPPHP
jgi:hypothetical protein